MADIQKTPLQRFNLCITSDATQSYLNQILSERKGSFVNNITALVANNATLQNCAPMSVIYAALKATALDLPLDPSLGCAYVIPYRNNRTGSTDAQFQLGAKGLLQLAIRSGQFLNINVTDIREGEIKGKDILTGEIRIEGAENRENLPIVGYAAYFRLVNGFSKTLYMSMAELKAHALRYSQTYKSEKTRMASKWSDDFDAMAKKTVLKLLLARYAPKSVEMQTINEAVKIDQSVYNEQNEASYLDNPDEQMQSVDDQTNEALKTALEAKKRAESIKDRAEGAKSSKNAEKTANKEEEDMPNEMFQ